MEGDDAAIVGRVRAGEIDAFRVLVERHSRKVFNLAFRMTGNEHDAEDIVQDTFMKAFRTLSRFESRSSFGTWLHRIAANCALDAIRARKVRDEVVHTEDEDHADAIDSIAATGPLPDIQAFGAEIREKVGAALKELTAAERAAFVLRHFEDMSIVEISKTN
jgi:RNA polymerase sigma-70 factor (ECF subfamily)